MHQDNEPENKKYTLSELLERLKTGDLEPIENGFNIIDSTPVLEGELTFGPEGFPESDFAQKFEKDFAGWQFGERLRSEYKVKKRFDESGEPVYELLVSDNLVGDIRHADTFVLRGISDEDQSALEYVGMADLEAVVEIRNGFSPYTRASNMQVYDARIDRIVRVQEVWDGDRTKLKEEQNYLVEGEVVSYVVDREYPYNNAVITLSLSSGELIKIELSNGYLNFDSGVLENFIPMEPEEGDLVQVNTTYGFWRSRYGYEGESNLYAHFCRSTHLLEPSDRRRLRYEDQRRFVDEMLEEIRNLNEPEEIRGVISRLVRSSITKEKGTDLINQERISLKQLIEEKLPQVEDRPLDFLDYTGQMIDFNSCYGEDPFSLSRGEFYQVCKRIAEGHYEILDRGSSDSVWALMFYHFTPEENGPVISKAVRNYFPRVLGKRSIRKENILEDPENIPNLHEKEYGHRIGNKVVMGEKDYDPEDLVNPENVPSEIAWFYKQALGYLSRTFSAEVSELYTDLLTHIYENELFMKESEDRFHEFAEYEHFYAIERNILGNILWEDDQFGTNIIGYRDQAAMEIYINTLPQLRSLAAKMDNEGWKNQGARDPASSLFKIVKYLDKIKGDLMQRNARWN